MWWAMGGILSVYFAQENELRFCHSKFQHIHHIKEFNVSPEARSGRISREKLLRKFGLEGSTWSLIHDSNF